MDLAVNGESNVPPGFRFHPTEEELLHYYLRKKVGYEKIDLDVIRDIDLNKLEPWDIRERCKIGCTPQNDWYLFSHKDKKYPSGTRTNRATAAGFWKATGRDKVIYSNEKRIGTRKTLVFYRGRAPHGHKSDWIMHEYRLDENNTNDPMTIKACNTVVPEDGWVVCRVFKKKNYNYNNKAIQNPSTLINSKNNNNNNNNNNDVLDQIIMGRSCNCKQQLNESNFNNNAAFVHLESQSPPSTESLAKNSPFCEQDCGFKAFDDTITAIQPGNAFHYSKIGFIDWVPLEDQLINGETSQQYASSSYCDPYKDLSFSLDQFQFINTRSGTTNQTSQVSSTDTDC